MVSSVNPSLYQSYYGSSIASALGTGTSSTTGAGSNYISSNAASTLSGSSTATLSGTAPAQTISAAAQALQTKINGYTTLLGSLSAFQTILTNTNLSDLTPDLTVSDTSVASVSSSQGASYSLTVTQLAKAQVTTTSPVTLSDGSTTAASNSTALGASGSLTISLGQYSTTSGTTSFSQLGQKPVSISVTASDTVATISYKINQAKAGVTAQVITNSDGSSSIQLTSQATGAAEGFQVTASSGSTGLTQFTYDQSTGGTTAATLNTKAQDANYFVNGAAETSATNTGVAIAPGINVDLARTGSTQVTQGVVPSTLLTDVQQMVSALNGLNGDITTLTTSGGALQGGTLATSSLSQDLRFAVLGGKVTGGFTSLMDIGITQNADGSVSFDQTTFTNAYTKDATSTTIMLESLQNHLITAALPYTGTGGQVAVEQNQAQAQYDQQTAIDDAQYASDTAAYSQAYSAYTTAAALAKMV